MQTFAEILENRIEGHPQPPKPPVQFATKHEEIVNPNSRFARNNLVAESFWARLATAPPESWYDPRLTTPPPFTPHRKRYHCISSQTRRCLSVEQARAREFFLFNGENLNLNFSRSELKQAFRALAKQFHPDTACEELTARRRQQFEHLREAYQTLDEIFA